MKHRTQPTPPHLTVDQIRQLLAAEQSDQNPDCFSCGAPVTTLRATVHYGMEEETRVATVYPCEHRWLYNVRVAEQVAAKMRAAATEATGPETPNVPDGVREAAEALAAELHRRATRLDDFRKVKPSSCTFCPAVQVDGEVVGLRGALGILLGGTVPGGNADELGAAYYQAWLERTAGVKA